MTDTYREPGTMVMYYHQIAGEWRKGMIVDWTQLRPAATPLDWVPVLQLDTYRVFFYRPDFVHDWVSPYVYDQEDVSTGPLPSTSDTVATDE